MTETEMTEAINRKIREGPKTKDWRELARAGSWKHVNRFVTQFEFSIPVSDIELQRMTMGDLKALLLQRVETLIDEKVEAENEG